MRRVPPDALIERQFSKDEEACLEALTVIMQRTSSKEAAGPTGGKNDGTNVKEDSADAPIIRR